jgi:Protein kinase domain/Lipoprotein LpqB beta-propeller domain
MSWSFVQVGMETSGQPRPIPPVPETSCIGLSVATCITVPTGGTVAIAGAPPARIGRYAIEGVLGAGGMAVVYLARDPVLGRAVALKVLHAGNDEHGASRLVREGQALARVSHRNVIQVHEVGREASGLIYIAMERIVGATLASWLAGPRTQREILEAFAAVARGLAAAHAAGLVHRDVKPENVMVGDDGRVCVLDFGLARALADEPGDEPGDDAGDVVGTPAYMSPEQWRGEPAGAPSDQFSFCVALWRALAEQHPFELRSRLALRASVIAGALRPPPRALPRRLRSVLRRGLAVDPAARWSSIDEVAAALDAIVATIAAPPRWRRLAGTIAGIAGIAIAVQLAVATASDTPARVPAIRLYTAPVPITSRGDVGRVAVSPDERQVAMLTRDAVLVQPIEPGAEPRVVLRGRPAYHALSWSPDGTALAFVAGPDTTAPPGLMLAELATGAVRRLGDDLGAVALLGNDELAATPFSSKELAFYRFADTAAPHRRCPLPGQFSGIRGLVFDPASDALYAQLDHGDRRASIVRIDRACRTRVVADHLPILSFVVRPGDRRVLVRLMGDHHLVEIGDDGASRLAQHVVQSRHYVPRAIRGDGALVHVDPSVRWALHAIGPGGARRELAGGAGESRFALAPDGRLAQIDGLYDGGLLRVGRLGGGMTTIAERAVRAVWSPDASRLAVLSSPDGGYQLAAWDPSTGAMSPPHRLAVPYDVEITWLDDRRVAYPVLHDRRAFRWIDLGTGATGHLDPGLGEAALSLVHAHRDRRLAFATEAPDAVTVWTMIEGQRPRAVATVRVRAPRSSRAMRVAWAHDDRAIVLHDAASGEIWSIDPAGNPAGNPAGDPASGPAGDPARATGGAPAIRMPDLEPGPGGGLTRLDGVFVVADQTITAVVSASSDIYLSAPIEEAARVADRRGK